MTPEDLQRADRIVDLDGAVALWDFGGDGPLIVCIHGLGGSRSNWVAVADELGRHGRVVIPDLVGFGDTAPLGRSSTVDHQVALVARLVEHLDAGPAILIGNSMGGLIALLTAARHERLVDRFVLVSSALPLAGPRLRPMTAVRLGLPLLPLIGPRLLERLMKARTPEESVDETMRLVMADPSRLDGGVRDVLIDFASRRLTMPWIARAFSDASRSIARYLVSPQRFERMVRSIDVPGLVIQGEADTIVRPSSAQWLNDRRPDWPLVLLPGVGHVPQLEVPDEFTRIVGGWIGDSPGG